MEDFSSSSKTQLTTIAASSGTDHDFCEDDDACSICLEPFSSDDPPTVTNCKHEYHLQCILEWSQRSKECPICWQLLVLKDALSQELLAAVEIERNSRSRHRSSTSSMFPRTPPEDFDFDPVSFSVGSDFDEHILQHLTAAALGRAHHFRRQRQRSSGLDPSQLLVFPTSNDSDLQQTYTTVRVESQSAAHPASPESESERDIESIDTHDQPTPNVLTRVNTGPNTMDLQDSPLRPRVFARQTSSRSPRRSRPSELLSFSENLKSKFSAASARYKESITKSTRGFKEKLLARNNSVKELSKEVQREVTAGIAGVARMMERLDPTSKDSGSSSPVSTGTKRTLNVSHSGKGLQENLNSQSLDQMPLETEHGTSSSSPMHVPDSLSSVPGQVEVARVQVALRSHGDQD